MIAWYSIQLEASQATVEALEPLTKSFRSTLELSSLAEGAALFLERDPAGSAVLYFTPSVARMARQHGAVATTIPQPTSKLSLLAGAPTAWRIHFPSYMGKYPE